ncbi:protein FRA10AC1 isoform X2 [Pistacia vera]|uniref:protein FRA10AC1 isoform X1 n=1 Tax=Pistacia vera TaxID=55513 RepID=UPI0012633738|nr:protein FRA10AC1 isoform X1 [Pistacia vera]XP_031273801.1 protein FRA10AC1 isoform X2 [Pistacia vera]
MASFSSIKSKIFDREERKQQYQAHIRGLNAYDRHKKFLNDYVAFYGKEKSSHLKLPVKTDQDTLREGYRFIRSEEDDKDSSWEQRLVKRYYDKLFKEYCIADMTHYKSGKIGLRWRTEKEVMSGKGQFVCGNKHCDEKDGLASYEVNFSYVEAGESKQALVKLVICERCAEKLHYKRRKEKELLERREKEDYRRKRDLSRSDHDTDEESECKERRIISEMREKEEHKRKREQSRSDDSDEESKRGKGLGRREKEDYKRNRDSSSRDRDSNEVHEGSKKKGKGKKASSNHNVDDDDNFDEFLEGMFP